MTTPAWPGLLPQAMLHPSFQEGFGEGRRVSATDTGPGKVWKRTSAAARPMSGGMNMTDAQFAIFQDFFRDDLAEGSLPFTFPDPHGGDDLLVRFAPSAVPGWSNAGPDIWQVSLPLEILP